jgi:excisionase family DNA binding protein
MSNLMTTKEAAEYLKLNYMTVYKLAQRGRIPASKIGGNWRFRKDLLDDWLAKQAKVVEGNEAFAYVVEHDIAIQDFMADRLMIFSGTPGVRGTATSPSSLRDGMNEFLRQMDITFRRDPETGRPRVNKLGSRTDRIQREMGEHYYVPERGKE